MNKLSVHAFCEPDNDSKTKEQNTFGEVMQYGTVIAECDNDEIGTEIAQVLDGVWKSGQWALESCHPCLEIRASIGDFRTGVPEIFNKLTEHYLERENEIQVRFSSVHIHTEWVKLYTPAEVTYWWKNMEDDPEYFEDQVNMSWSTKKYAGCKKLGKKLQSDHISDEIYDQILYADDE